MIFSPTYYRDGDICEQCEMLSLISDDGIELEGVMYEPSNASNTILFFVGRSNDAVGFIGKLSQAYPKSRIITFNYRSYGKSQGRASEKNLLSDALEIATFVEKKYDEFYLVGFSIGSNVAAYVASNRNVKALFLLGAFDSIASLARSKFVDRSFFPMINLSKLFRYQFRTANYVKEVKADTYLFVSKDDETTYIQNARDLKDSVKNLVYYKEFENLSHKELLCFDTVVEKINEVIDV
ncbi:MAG: alpha/beta hydrolase [Sulfurimonas sp.]